MAMSRSFGRQRVDHPAVDGDLARGDLLEAGEHPQQRRLAAARRADQHHELAVGDVDRDAVQHLERAVGLADVADRDGAHRSVVPPRRLRRIDGALAAVERADARRSPRRSSRTSSAARLARRWPALDEAGMAACPSAIRKASATAGARDAVRLGDLAEHRIGGDPPPHQRLVGGQRQAARPRVVAQLRRLQVGVDLDLVGGERARRRAAPAPARGARSVKFETPISRAWPRACASASASHVVLERHRVPLRGPVDQQEVDLVDPERRRGSARRSGRSASGRGWCRRPWWSRRPRRAAGPSAASPRRPAPRCRSSARCRCGGSRARARSGSPPCRRRRCGRRCRGRAAGWARIQGIVRHPLVAPAVRPPTNSRCIDEEQERDRQRHHHRRRHHRAPVGVELGRELGEPDRQRLDRASRWRSRARR